MLFKNDRLYGKEKVCIKLDISLSKLNRMLAADTIPYIKLGYSVRFEGDSLNDFINHNNSLSSIR